MKLITAREHSTAYRFRVHLDESKTDSQGGPDPAYVKEYRFSKTPPPGQTAAEYLARVLAEVKALAAMSAAADTAVALPAEGTTL